MANPWEVGADNIAAGLFPVSPILGSGSEFGFITNPGAQCVYIENPSYVPLNIQPGNEFGYITPPNIQTGTQPGIIIPPYTWASFPVGRSNQVLYDARLYVSIFGQRGSGTSGVNQRGPYFLLAAEAGSGLSYPAGSIPAPRMARYYFYDSDNPQVTKGTLLRPVPLPFYQALGTTGSTSTGAAYLYCSPASATGTPLACVWNIAGQSQNFQFVVNGNQERMCIIGAEFDFPNLPVSATPAFLGANGFTWWMDEISLQGRIFPDVVLGQDTTPNNGKSVNVPSGFNQVQMTRSGTFFVPIPGARGVACMQAGTIAAPSTHNVLASVTLYLAEY